MVKLDTLPAITRTDLPAGKVGRKYAVTVTTTGSPKPTLAVTRRKLPPGLKLTAAGKITGTPTKAGEFSFTLTASSVVSRVPTEVSRRFTLVVKR
ncbi:MAG: putative Ig domain-containing protein [Nocardioidaceae bacterium]